MAATTTVPSASPISGSRSFLRRLCDGDEIARLITFLFAASVVLVTLLLILELWHSSALARHKFGLQFFFTRVWDPIAEQFGALPFIYGTLVTATTALVLAVPLGIGAAIFLAELAPARLSDGLEFFIDLLAAVPSVIYGLLGMFIVVPLMRDYVQPGLKKTLGFLPLFSGPAYGVGFLTAGIVLAIMVSLGATRWESTWKVVVPFARTGILGSIFLALARALGETMAVTMVIGNTPTISSSLFSPGYSIAAVIANEFTEATGDLHLQALIELGLVLFLLTFLLNGVARLLIVVTSQRGGGTALA
jgi:phosphate transport system permease protein